MIGTGCTRVPSELGRREFEWGAENGACDPALGFPCCLLLPLLLLPLLPVSAAAAIAREPSLPSHSQGRPERPVREQ